MARSLTLLVIIQEGTPLDAACAEIVGLANQLNMQIAANFNGVHLVANPGDRPEIIMWSYQVIKAGKIVELAMGGDGDIPVAGHG